MTFSLCMIVKNEAKVLNRCLTSFAGLFDEIIIVDTGSTDRTKKIAAKFTDKIYDFEWIDDFAAARNFAFSKASGDYIYSCDADEVIDKRNYAKFASLKEAMLPEIEIVQMLYEETDSAVLNAKCEYRAKLFKRQRTFIWQDPVHETVRTEPIVYDSDIVIFHRPVGKHHERDFEIFIKAFERGERFTKNLYHTYVSELYKCGTAEDFIRAIPVFVDRMMMELDADAYTESACVLAHAFRAADEPLEFFGYAAKVLASGMCSEMCYELGMYYFDNEDWENAVLWFSSAVYASKPVVDIRTSGDVTLRLIADCYEAMGERDMAMDYIEMAEEWKLPEEQI